MLLHLHSSFSWVTLDLFQKCSMMEDLGDCGVKVVATKNMGLVWDVFFSLSLSWSSPLLWSSFLCSSSLSQSDDIGNYLWHIFPSGVHIAHYMECLVNFIGGLDEERDSVDEVSTGWLVCMGPSWLLYLLHLWLSQE